ncbi:reverse transcriptase domain-containing protein [Tanacetum coccineum]
MASKFLSKYFPPSMVTKLRNDINNFRQLPDESLFKAWERYKLSIDRCPNHNMLPVTQIDTFYNGGESSSSTTSSSSEIAALAQQMIAMRNDMLQMFHSNQQVNSVTPSCETCGGPHSYYECQAAGGYTQDGALPSNTVPNPREQITSITTRSGLTTVEPSIPPPVPPSPREEVEKEPETLMDEVHITSLASTAHVPPPGI